MKTIFLAISLFLAGAVMAQAPDCRSQSATGGVNWGIADDGNGNIYVAGDSGVMRSCNNGESWSESGSWPPPGLAVLVDPDDPAIVYLGTDRGVYRSTDYGVNWQQFGTQMGGLVMALAAQPDGAILAGADSGIYRSYDDGETWSLLAAGPSNVRLRALLAHPADVNLIYAGAEDGIHKSLDGGASWQRIEGGMTDGKVNDLDVDPANASVIYATAFNALWLSSDGGTTWTRLGQSRLLDLALDPRNAQVMYLVSRVNGVMKSVNGGWNWGAVNRGIAHLAPKLQSVHVLPTGRVLVGTEFEGVMMSDDGGATWQRSGLEPAPPPAAPEPTAGGHAHVTVTTRYLYEDSVPAGSDAPFRVTVRNQGPDPSTDTRVTFSWSRQPLVGQRRYYDYTVTSSHGSCTRDARPECTLGTLAPGASATLEFRGATVPGKLAYYDLRVTVSNAQGYGQTASDGIGSSVTVFSSDGGAGAELWLLLLLAPVSCVVRARSC